MRADIPEKAPTAAGLERTRTRSKAEGRARRARGRAAAVLKRPQAALCTRRRRRCAAVVPGRTGDAANVVRGYRRVGRVQRPIKAGATRHTGGERTGESAVGQATGLQAS